MFDGVLVRQTGASSILGMFARPVFADPEQEERANILRVVIIGTVIITVSMITLIMLFHPEAAFRCAGTMAFVSALGLTLLHLNRRGNTRLAASLFAGGLIALITVLAVSAGGACVRQA